ncbi:BlaI/MecI/CopY family transcriptional regulator [Amycolatopsis acidiphila]|uniref:BlaI/MecI/CopY family transcriptional regulator n=1 Tax=Amycolatopsis acidiphila TaxID=715473 RepID=A0A558AJF0_9PSEU|nr:BlaI/MecI/CopY family transcriptional regulator [Amycolatopsis acidiphila]TVT24331.1 BlaI/MecI/CopY family transcriptional regulator [Amycolatopsis acidiphila]UIJ62534.1 BlaI/MecI/CopY family transcriptional regulator [Amycolatopsis acidiphila]
MTRRFRGGRRGPGELETEVLAALWSEGRPMTATEVQESVDTELAYTTVVTILSRLHDKGALTREKRGRSFAYAPVEDEAGLAARRMRKLLDTQPDRARVLARFVSNLSNSDEQMLRALLRDTGQE